MDFLKKLIETFLAQKMNLFQSDEFTEKVCNFRPKFFEKPHVETKAKAAVTKTLEYAYDDYAVALLAKASKVTISRKNHGRKISRIAIDGGTVDGYFVSHGSLQKGKEITIFTE